MKLYNSLSQKVETIDLKEKIGIYVCGITPDGPTHIGHAFTFINYDVLVRYLKFLGAQVFYVQNVTDIDDDILLRSKVQNRGWQDLGQHQTHQHINNMDGLNALRPDFYPKATDNIREMVEIIKMLVKKDFAYQKNSSIYFSVKKDKNFGKLSKFPYRAMLEIANERGNFPLDPNKKDPLDFVLWQKSKKGEPWWESPWGKGRPGWHIECSAMSMKYLGPTISIHGGGEDLLFPHHEAEIAQSENYTGKQFVKIWMHSAMVYCAGKKMSKSLGNIIFVSDLLQKYSSNAIRIYLLSHHYRQPFNYDEEEIKTAAKKAHLIEKPAQSSKSGRTDHKLKEKASAFFEALDEDFHTPEAINYLVKLSQSGKSEIVRPLGEILGLKFN